MLDKFFGFILSLLGGPLPDEPVVPTTIAPEVLQKVLCRFKIEEQAEVRHLIASQEASGESFHDPIEDLERFRASFELAEKKVEKKLRWRSRGMGFCHEHWELKAQILREEFGIEWFSPNYMNPHIIFD